MGGPSSWDNRVDKCFAARFTAAPQAREYYLGLWAHHKAAGLTGAHFLSEHTGPSDEKFWPLAIQSRKPWAAAISVGSEAGAPLLAANMSAGGRREIGSELLVPVWSVACCSIATGILHRTDGLPGPVMVDKFGKPAITC
jgi:hypothetical protein